MIKDKGKDLGFWALIGQDLPVPIIFDAVTLMKYNAVASTLDVPIEGNAFETYNKKINPLTITLDMVFQGSQYWQAAVILELRIFQNMAVRLALVTPSNIYMDMTLETFSFNREQSKGSELLAVTMTLKEVMDTESMFSVRNVIRRITDKMAKRWMPSVVLMWAWCKPKLSAPVSLLGLREMPNPMISGNRRIL